jgi:hypothetical protein
MAERANNMKRKGDVSSDAGQSVAKSANLVRDQIQAKKECPKDYDIWMSAAST